ncbi:MAG TPA: hypothetical protein PK228_14170 [Saprospiraceae bacterium]|nr:hypothetical protein [Saprospiraceae bacterium]
MPHDNSHLNDKPHHLYEIWDNEEMEVFKYGISANLIGADGLSKRMRVQLETLNLAANYIRYTARILLTDIAGRVEAERIEQEHIEIFRKKHRRMPRGNLR